jgi:hypothetical protein
MARGIAYALDEGGIAKLVKGFFVVNPLLPPKGLKVDGVEIFEGTTLTFTDLLKEILKTKGTMELLLVVHGYVNGAGLLLPLANGAPGGTLHWHLEMLMKIDSSGQPPTTQDLDKLQISKQAFTDLIDLMKKVQNMSFKAIEWRACDLGKTPPNLEMFRKFFGATRMGAPRMENIFGASPFEITPMNKVPEMKGFASYSYPDKNNPTVIIFMKLDENNWPSEGKMFAASRTDLESWIKKHINPQGSIQGNSVQIHALWKDPDSSHPLDNPTPILPIDPEYGPNIIYTP